MDRNLKWFDSLTRRDFENQAVLAEILEVFKERDRLAKELSETERSLKEYKDEYGAMTY